MDYILGTGFDVCKEIRNIYSRLDLDDFTLIFLFKTEVQLAFYYFAAFF